MKVNVVGKELKVTEAINDYIERKLERIDKYFEERLAIPVYVAQNPLDCVAIGTQKMLEDMETLKRIAKSKA